MKKYISDFRLSLYLSRVFLVLSIMSLVLAYYDKEAMTSALIFFLLKLLLDKDRKNYLS